MERRVRRGPCQRLRSGVHSDVGAAQQVEGHYAATTASRCPALNPSFEFHALCKTMQRKRVFTSDPQPCMANVVLVLVRTEFFDVELCRFTQRCSMHGSASQTALSRTVGLVLKRGLTLMTSALLPSEFISVALPHLDLHFLAFLYKCAVHSFRTERAFFGSAAHLRLRIGLMRRNRTSPKGGMT